MAAPQADLLAAICSENLGVYRASPSRLREDVSQEDEISHDYRGRLVYELLQNADDAMRDDPTHQDRVVFRLTETDLWIGNTGRPLDEQDVRGLCGIGASRKGEAVDRRRAAIGHKGMGFKSVLEVTAAPEVFSEMYSLRLGADVARPHVERVMEEVGETIPAQVPSMRFPAPPIAMPPEWEELREGGVRTLFRLPLREGLSAEQRRLLGARLVELPVTAILFLKHLESVEVSLRLPESQATKTWTVGRERREDAGWGACTGLSGTGVYRIKVANDSNERTSFMVAHDADVEIGRHRDGLSEHAWRGVDLTEVSVAAPESDGRPGVLPEEWRRFHVFLPTGEPCPYPFIVNGAFATEVKSSEVV